MENQRVGKSITNAPSYLTEKCEFGGFSFRAVHVVQEWLLIQKLNSPVDLKFDV